MVPSPEIPPPPSLSWTMKNVFELFREQAAHWACLVHSKCLQVKRTACVFRWWSVGFWGEVRGLHLALSFVPLGVTWHIFFLEQPQRLAGGHPCLYRIFLCVGNGLAVWLCDDAPQTLYRHLVLPINSRRMCTPRGRARPQSGPTRPRSRWFMCPTKECHIHFAAPTRVMDRGRNVQVGG